MVEESQAVTRMAKTKNVTAIDRTQMKLEPLAICSTPSHKEVKCRMFFSPCPALPANG